MSDAVVIIGGGPAGMMAAVSAASRGKKVVIVEKNNTLGKKLLITGKGRCNITNDCDISEFINNVPVNASFLYSAFYSFTNRDLISMLRDAGLETKVERGKRIFPVSDKAGDVLKALVSILKKSGVKLLHAEVKEIRCNDEEKTVIFTDGRCIKCQSAVIATGGISYPVTGSTGDGYRFAKKLGHTVVPLKGSLVPLELSSAYTRELMGLSLKNTGVKVLRNGRVHYSDFGELLFTHYGMSGPVILSASSHMRDFYKYSYKIVLDLKPALDEQTLDARILRDFDKNKNRDFINSLDELLPKKLIPVIVAESGISGRKKVNEISKSERRALINTVKRLEFDVTGLRPAREAIITSGGVNVKEINPSTMESKIQKGLYFAGEVMDVDAYTGGFNLQIAFSTGWLAGQNV